MKYALAKTTDYEVMLITKTAQNKIRVPFYPLLRYALNSA
ncbi:hypothetical protein EDC16_10845 [Testudinibacter aquarius]|uniref:Uncharacterized protein n=1 Tax=Testudinibacter aquarius TaxID=1524974 RepID=A0A4R3Y4L9_9PAST|nr:hypothetical protein EDC16_10845 [Testudinibacter aquarius]